MFDGVVFTGTVNLGAVVTTILTLVAVMTAYYRIKIEIIRENRKTRECVHQIPGHPESATKQGETTS